MYQIQLSDGARRFFEAAPASLQRRLDRCFVQLRRDPRRHGNIKALKGQWKSYLRYRVGDWRVVYRIDEAGKVVYVTDVANRREVYD